MRDYLKLAVLFATSFALNASAAESKKPTIFYNKVGAALTKDKPNFFFNKVGAALSSGANPASAPKRQSIVEKPAYQQPISARERPKQVVAPAPAKPIAPDIYTPKQQPITKIAKPAPKPVVPKIEYLEVKTQTDEAVSKQEPATAILYDILNDGEAREKIKSKKL